MAFEEALDSSVALGDTANDAGGQQENDSDQGDTVDDLDQVGIVDEGQLRKKRHGAGADEWS